MGRIDACVAADRDTFWEAACGARPGQLREGEPGRRLIFEGPHGLVRLQLVPTGQGGTRVRVDHPGGWLSSLYWRAWVARIAAPPWGPSRTLATVAAVLTLAGMLSALSGAGIPTPGVHAPRAIAVASLEQWDELRVHEPALFARLPGEVEALALTAQGLTATWGGGHLEHVRWPEELPLIDDPTWTVVQEDGLLFVVDTLHDERMPLLHGLARARHPTVMRTSDGLRIAFASGREVFVVDARPLRLPR